MFNVRSKTGIAEFGDNAIRLARLQEIAKPTVQVFTLARPVKKGEKLTSDVFESERALIHRTPQNAVTHLQGKQYYAARHLLPGRTLVESDLVVGQQVVVLTQAIPARSPIALENTAIRERAVDVPHDAIRSLEGLSMLAANRLLHPGDILRKRDLTKAKLIKRGQTVDVESLGNHFRIASELVGTSRWIFRRSDHVTQSREQPTRYRGRDRHWYGA